MSFVQSQPARLLIVDDDLDNLHMLFDFLQQHQFHVLVAKNGQQALVCAQRVRPDLIFLDIMMPVMDGFETCKQLKNNKETKNIPIIFMSALVDAVDKVKGFELGAADYITKPIEQREVLARLETHLALYRLQADLQRQTHALAQHKQELETFTTAVAHDLKNALNAVLGYSDELADIYHGEVKNDAEITEVLSLLDKSGRQMADVVQALLLLADLSKDKTVTPSELDMGAQLERMVNNRMALLLQRRQVTVQRSANWPTIRAYPPWIEETWALLIKRLLKQNADARVLHFAWHQQGAHLLFGVQVEQAMSSEQWQHKSTESSTETISYDLNLIILQRLVEKLGGDFGGEVNSKTGRCLYFRLPLAIIAETA